MADIFSKRRRSEIMSNIKGKLTGLEQIGWEILKEAGFTFRKHPKGIFGKPDAANKSKKIAVFFDSEFWHGYKWKIRKGNIKSNQVFWVAKIERNIARDKAVNVRLRSEGWTVIRLWEHQLAARKKIKTIKALKGKWKQIL
ncbi:hypothetical protein AUJ46_00205 [Candidatus Peregrinibacteria bacterium CG1_02_54_53]|nr:MAG: hypothetical protein AUJ46_00205 [Candidatus Peregrinibacteria bacterium CG1_02_54_53]